MGKKMIKDIKNGKKQKSKVINIIIIISLTIIIASLVCFIIFDPFMIFNNTADEISNSVKLEQPIINYTDGQAVDLQDLNISWQIYQNVKYYTYKVVLLKGMPSADNEIGSLLIAENSNGIQENSFIISKENLQEGKWMKITVTACNDSEQVKSSTCIFINLSGKAKNSPVNIKYTSKAPVIDGIINENEYGQKIHSSDYSNNQFIDIYDPDHSIKDDFYMTWDKQYLYLAWVVYTKNQFPVGDYNNDNIIDDKDLNHMWECSSVQFMLCFGAPDFKYKNYQTKSWEGNYLETGISIMNDRTSKKIIWSKPDNAKYIISDDITFTGSRDENNQTTTYEVKIPLNKIGINELKEGDKIGLTYGIGDQKNFNTEPSMLEWQDAILGNKNMDAGAVIYLIN